MPNPFPNTAPAAPVSLADFARLNPGFGQPAGMRPEGNFGASCSIDRVMLAGGQLMSYLPATGVVPLERVFRKLPLDGVFTALPNQPFQFEMGVIQVPAQMGFVVLDYRFAIYRPSGSAAGDFVELEKNRLSTQVGWDILANADRQGNFSYELNPIPPADSNAAYQSNPNPGFIPGGPPQPATDDQFTAARFQQVQAGTDSALSLMPQRHHREGLLHVPAPWVLHSSQALIVRCSVFRAIQIPIAFFEAEIFGFLLPDSNLIAIEKAIAPCLTNTGGV